MTDVKLPPPIMWAQRPTLVFLTINLEDVSNPEVKFTKNTVYFHGIGGREKKEYEITINLYKEIDPDKSRSLNKGRCIEIVLVKANDKDHYWPTLTTGIQKHHWLKCDFNKWQDEDDSEDEGVSGMNAGGGDFEEVMRNMAGLGGSEKPPFNAIDPEEPTDSDDEPIPDLE